MRVFLDTNVLLSAFFGKGLCQDLVSRLLRSDHELLIGEPVAREFVRIARRKLRAEPADLSYALEVLRRQTTVPASRRVLPAIPDPDDRPVVACALAAGADLFITGDKALLELGKVEGLPIVSPRQAWERLRVGHK
ncbi:MAG: putative toxin-antitoxin system toxin component, PIN family [Betaproteobacteria bacterium]|nr:putative toxin-antitoxin system toxin component, PIN family [Betaproteobacteria bacterium]